MKKKIPLLIISIAFSVIIWGTISLSEEYYANVNVPLRVVGFPNGFSIGSEIPENITIKLRGIGWKLFAVNIGKDVYRGLEGQVTESQSTHFHGTLDHR